VLDDKTPWHLHDAFDSSNLLLLARSHAPARRGLCCLTCPFVAGVVFLEFRPANLAFMFPVHTLPLEGGLTTYVPVRH